MVVGDFYAVGAIFFPDKTDSPLVVDSYAVLALSVTVECLKAVAWGYSQIFKHACRTQYF